VARPPDREHSAKAGFAVLDRLLTGPGIIAALLVATNATAAPPDDVAPNASVEIAPVEIVAAPALVLESLPVVIDAQERREIEGMTTAVPAQPIRDPVMRRRGLALAISSVVGVPLIGAGGIYILGEQFDCAFGAALGGVSRKCPHGPLGPTLMGLGAATSITLLAVGLTLVSKSKTPQAALTLPAPIVSRHGGGVAWAIRF
jgi:hypothetical protein